MSVLNLVLLSSTPLLGFAVLIGMSRFESTVLDEGNPDETGDAMSNAHAAVASAAAGPLQESAPAPVPAPAIAAAAPAAAPALVHAAQTAA